MPSIKITDQLEAEVDVELNEDSAIPKYIEDLRRLKLPNVNFSSLVNATLDKTPLKNFETGLSFEQPVDVGAGGAELKIAAGLSGSVKLYSPKDKQLFDPEFFGDPIPITDGQLYVGVGVGVTLAGELTGEKGDITFGFSGGGRVAINTYRLFEKSSGGAFPLALDALRESFRSFSIPGDLDDLARLPVGAVASVEGGGTLKFSGSVNLLTVTNPLAVVGLPDPIGEVKVTSGNAIKLGASVELTTAYQIRARKTGPSKVRVGFYRKRGSDFTLKATASAGLTGGIGDRDLVEALLKAISKNPEADIEELKKGGLSAEQAEAIKKVVEAGIARKLELSLGFELNAAGSTEAAFLYDIDLGKLDEAGRRAVHLALDGDLSGLTGDEAALPPGVALVRSIFTEIQRKKHTLKINLLGIYSFISVSSLVLKGAVLFEPETGELVIADKVTATRIAASIFNFAADREKLRKLLFESVLVTAVYRGSKIVVQPPELKLSHGYFELHTKTGAETMKNNLDVFEALGLLTAAEKKKLMGGETKFGRTSLYVETAYDDNLVNSLFFNGAARRTREEYEKAGRNAVKLLILPGERDEARRLPASDDKLWNEMRKTGQPGFKHIEKLKKLSAPILGAVTADYSLIVWWAETMTEMGERLEEIRQFFKANPNADPENNTFKSLRKKLASKLKDVASDTRSEFGDPWGLVAVDQLSGRRADAKAHIMGPLISLIRQRGEGQ